MVRNVRQNKGLAMFTSGSSKLINYVSVAELSQRFYDSLHPQLYKETRENHLLGTYAALFSIL